MCTHTYIVKIKNRNQIIILKIASYLFSNFYDTCWVKFMNNVEK